MDNGEPGGLSITVHLHAQDGDGRTLSAQDVGTLTASGDEVVAGDWGLPLARLLRAIADEIEQRWPVSVPDDNADEPTAQPATGD
jgi:hypothetical protein